MKVKATVEQSRESIAEIEVDDSDLLEYINNGGEHDFESLDAARAGLDDQTFMYVLREYVEYEVTDTNPSLVGIPLSPGDTDTRVHKVEVA